MTSNVSLGKTMHILLFLLGHWPEGIKLSCRKSHYSEQLYEDRKQVKSYRLPHRTQHQMLVESLPYVPVLPWDWLGWVLPTSTFVSISMVATLLFRSSLLYMDISLSCLYKMITLKREKFCQLILFFYFLSKLTFSPRLFYLTSPVQWVVHFSNLVFCSASSICCGSILSHNLIRGP